MGRGNQAIRGTPSSTSLSRILIFPKKLSLSTLLASCNNKIRIVPQCAMRYCAVRCATVVTLEVGLHPWAYKTSFRPQTDWTQLIRPHNCRVMLKQHTITVTSINLSCALAGALAELERILWLGDGVWKPCSPGLEATNILDFTRDASVTGLTSLG